MRIRVIRGWFVLSSLELAGIKDVGIHQKTFRNFSPTSLILRKEFGQNRKPPGGIICGLLYRSGSTQDGSTRIVLYLPTSAMNHPSFE